MKATTSFLWLISFAALLSVSTSQRIDRAIESPDVHKLQGETQGTQYHISYSGIEEHDLKAAVDKFLADFDQVFSNYRPDSEISRFNRQATLDWFAVSPELEGLVAQSLVISRKTEGAFDVTIGALLKLWGFGPYKRVIDSLPDPAAIAAALRQSGYQQLETRADPPALRRKVAQLEIDLSGIAQGHAVDQIVRLLESRGLHSFMVEIGGEVFAKGEKIPGVDWRIAIEAPRQERGTIAAIIRPRGQGLATSGDYRNYFEKEGRRYSHIIDPRHGIPVQHGLASVSVLAPTVMEADAYAKVWMVFGTEAAREKARAWNLPSFLIIRDGQSFTTIRTAGFEVDTMELASP